MREILKIQLIPSGCFYSNLRTLLPKDQWQRISKKVRAAARGVCSVCGNKTAYLDAHEVWSFDKKTGVQKLTGIIAVCRDCHSVIHFERTALRGDEKRAEEHFCKVNGATYSEFLKARAEANAVQRGYSDVAEWKTDLSYLFNAFPEEYFSDVFRAIFSPL